MINTKSVFNWSGGKDSALCLYKVLEAKMFDVQCLLTTLNSKYQRISMHGVREELLDLQAKNLNLPLLKVQLPEMPTMEVYEQEMEKTFKELKDRAITHSIFGDIFLEDLRKYRENRLKSLGFKAVFPLWKMDTTKLVHEFIDLGFKSIIVCVNEKYLDKSFAGRIIDKELVKDLPANVDPAGENGEYHSFVFDGPIYKEPIPIEIGETVYRIYATPKDSSTSSYNCNNSDAKPAESGFWYTDLLRK